MNGQILRIRISPVRFRRAGRHCRVRQTPCMRRPLINSLLRTTRIAPMSRRRAKCFVSIAGVGRGFPFPFSLEGTTIQTIQTPHVRDTSLIQGPGSIPRNRLSSCRWFARHDRRLRWGGRRTAQRDRRKRDQTSTADHFRVPAERGGRRAVPLGLIGLILD